MHSTVVYKCQPSFHIVHTLPNMAQITENVCSFVEQLWKSLLPPICGSQTLPLEVTFTDRLAICTAIYFHLRNKAFTK